MKKDEKYKAPVDKFEIPANPVYDQPLDSIELINKYGTYEIQPTNDSGHDFPKIAQGLPKEENRKVLDKD
ncbi:MAG: hypothetical protein II372_02350 [Clostridia bacterium]|nr:hypothetical protein [Clostridia bacterium]MBQ2316123.1 hypothetical protein [Clostridia bacterium]MEE0807991.1 hypothetical protein [Acutalibacteraceae bacterium]